MLSFLTETSLGARKQRKLFCLAGMWIEDILHGALANGVNVRG